MDLYDDRNDLVRSLLKNDYDYEKEHCLHFGFYKEDHELSPHEIMEVANGVSKYLKSEGYSHRIK